MSETLSIALGAPRTRAGPDLDVTDHRPASARVFVGAEALVEYFSTMIELVADSGCSSPRSPRSRSMV